MKTKFILIVLLFFYFNVQGQSLIRNLISEGMHLAYNLELDAAEKIFYRVIELRPDSPLGYYHIAQLHFWIFLGSRDPGEYQIFLKFADLTQEKIYKVLEKNPKDYRTIYLAGNLASFRAMAQAAQNSSVDAFWSSKKAVNYFEETLELNPKFYDAYLGLGLFDYAMSFVPDFLQWAVNLTGLSSDKERGFRYIKTAFQKGTSVKTEASFHLAKIYTDYLAEYDSALIHLQDLTSKYPSNSVFIYQHAVTLIKEKQLDNAMGLLNRVSRLENKKLPQIKALAHYRKGEIFFKKNQFKNAIAEYEKFLDLSKELDFTGYASLNNALCYKLLGNDEEFKSQLELMQSGNEDIFEDAYANLKRDKYLFEGISPVELKLIRMKNYLDAGRYRAVLDSLKNNIEEIENSDLKATAYIYFGEAAMHLKKYSDAFYALDQASGISLQNERWIKPMALLLKAKVKFFSGEKKLAKDLIEEASDKNIFEFKGNIQSQIEWLKRRLKG